MRIKKKLLKGTRYLLSEMERAMYLLGFIPVTKLCLPDFLGIGAQKAGTTWLYENLRCHPGIFMPEEKELHYFDWNFHESLKLYAEQFRPGRFRIKGEITPGYSILPIKRIRFIRGIMPELKLIFIIRNPVERAWSQAVMNLLKRPKKKYEEIDETEFYDHFRSLRSIKRGDYLTIIDNWSKVFDRDRIFIGFFEEIKERPRELLRKIFTHLDVSQNVDWDTFPYNRKIGGNPEISIPPKYDIFLKNMYKKDIELLHERFGECIGNKVNW